MLKKLLVPVAVLITLSAYSANAQWKFIKVFPDTNLTFTNGLNNTIATDPNGRVWMTAQAGGTDSVLTSAGKYAGAWDIFIYNPDGSLYKKLGPVLSFNGAGDTLYTSAAGYGMCTDPDGNIVVLRNSLTLRRINYKTYDVMAKAVNPLVGYSSSLASPMTDAANEVFITTVLPTTGVGPAALSSDFSSVLISVDTSMYGQYARNISVTSDGNDVYVHHIGLGSFHYHSANGTLGPYVFVDTLFKNLVIESSAWRPHTHQLWVSSGNVTSGMPNPPYSGYAWYGFDMSNPDSPVLKDSLIWNPNTGLSQDLLASDPRPRGIAFSPTGDTAYVGAFDIAKGMCEQFYTKATAVNEPPEVVSSYSLSQNYPNPFNPSTKIDYTLKSSGNVTLVVYDVLGRQVQTLVNGFKAAGKYSVTFNGDNLSSGVYVYILKTSTGVTITKKMILMK